MDRSKEKYTQQLEASREWKKANPGRHAELARAYRARNREKTTAQNRLNYAIKAGRMVRGSCEVCGTDEKVHAHHHDYTKPLDVKWLCFQCHKASHPVDAEDKQVKFSGATKARLPGPSNPNAALTADEVRQIRWMLDLGISQEKIGRVFGVTQVTISRIKLGDRYTNVT
jgi:DNA-binding CsgD family transcriptional regulator